MGFPINGDLIPSVSGFANLGINVSSNGRDAFDITTLRPFGHIHLVSGVYHDPLLGQSGVIRYNRATPAFQVSLDGGLTFQDVVTGATVVTSVGVIGDVNLTGNVDFATRASGFMVIEDTGDASPLLWAVNTLGLSGLWRFPTQGFNGRVVNALTDFNGTEAQGVINVVGASGIVVDIIGQIMTITPGNTLPKTFAQTFASSLLWSVAHNLGTADVLVAVYDDSTPRVMILPDNIVLTDSNTVSVFFNTTQAGRVVIIGF
jgi:hypothetical protein